MEFLQLHLCCAGRHSPQPIPAGQRLHIPGHPGCRHSTGHPGLLPCHRPARPASVPRAASALPNGPTLPAASIAPGPTAAACAVRAAPPVLLRRYRRLPLHRAARPALLFPALLLPALLFPALPGHVAPGRRAFPAARVLRAAPAMALLPARSAPATPETRRGCGRRDGNAGCAHLRVGADKIRGGGGFTRVYMEKETRNIRIPKSGYPSASPAGLGCGGGAWLCKWLIWALSRREGSGRRRISRTAGSSATSCPELCQAQPGGSGAGWLIPPVRA